MNLTPYSWLYFFIVLLLIADLVLVIILMINVLNDPNTENLNASAMHTASGTLQNEGLTDDLKCVAPEPEYSLLPNPTIKPGTIFVSVASYRDPECSTTVRDLFTLASNPDRVFVGTVEQNKPGEAKESCVYNCPECKVRLDKGQIRVQLYTHEEARGPSFARWAASKLWNGEEFFLMVDSHTYFEKNWDSDLISQWEKTNDPKAIISSYPPTKEQMADMKRQGFKTTVANCNGSYDGNLFKAKANIITPKTPGIPQRIPFIAAGFFFGRYTLLYDNPWDPWASAFVFFYEEALMNLGLWKAGYNIYAPSKPVCSHHYGRPGASKFFENSKWHKCKERAETRAMYYFGLKTLNEVHKDFIKDIDKYYVGTQRTVQSYLDFIKFDSKKKTVGVNMC